MIRNPRKAKPWFEPWPFLQGSDWTTGAVLDLPLAEATGEVDRLASDVIFLSLYSATIFNPFLLPGMAKE